MGKFYTTMAGFLFPLLIHKSACGRASSIFWVDATHTSSFPEFATREIGEGKERILLHAWQCATAGEGGELTDRQQSKKDLITLSAMRVFPMCIHDCENWRIISKFNPCLQKFLYTIRLFDTKNIYSYLEMLADLQLLPRLHTVSLLLLLRQEWRQRWRGQEEFGRGRVVQPRVRRRHRERPMRIWSDLAQCRHAWNWGKNILILWPYLL